MLLASTSLPAPHLLPPCHQHNSPDSSSYHMPAAKRPKLSLQTSSLPTTHYGTSGSTTASNRTDNMTAATPTTLNTFANTVDLSIRPSPISAVASPSTTLRSLTKGPPTSRPKRPAQPYELNLPFGVRSILKNSSLPADLRRGSLSTAASASPLSANHGRKVFFPEPKRVKFAGEEEVTTRIYTKQHYDLSSSEDESSGSEAAFRSSNDDNDIDATAVRLSNKTASNVDEVQRGRRTSAKSPSLKRRTTRKRRRWQWTLSNVESTASTDEQDIEQESSAPRGGSHSQAPSLGVSVPSVTDNSKDTIVVAIDEVVATPTSASSSEELPPS